MGRILIVDDEVLLGEELQEALDLEGLEFHYVSSAKDGLKARATEQFDLIVTDLKMPEMGGLEFLGELSNCKETAPIVVMSGHGAESNRVQAMELGAVACFAKPFDIDEFVGEIQKILT